MFIQLDISWLRHPFPVSSFRIAQSEQIQILQGLGLRNVRCIPFKSDPEVQALLLKMRQPISHVAESDDTHDAVSAEAALQASTAANATDGLDLLQAPESQVVKFYDQRFTAAAQQYNQVVHELISEPEKALQTSSTLVAGYIAEMLNVPQTAIRLLSENVGEQQGAHPVNVTILALMLGKAYGLEAKGLTQLGLAALLHDVGKMDCQPLLWGGMEELPPPQRRNYESHVDASVRYARRMGLSETSLLAIAQHHETLDGKGFPCKLQGEALTVEGQILALTNCYDKLCNPIGNVLPLTPHEALSTLFAQRRGAYRKDLVELFVRVMGVYPPGSIVQLNDDQYGMVISARSDIPLKPTVLLYQKDVARESAKTLDLSQFPGKVIKRSLRPSQLSREILDYLSPRKRVCYFFQRAVPLLNPQGDA